VDLRPHDDAALSAFWDSSRAGAFLANVNLIAVLAPVAEELWFRGLGYRLLERYGTAIAIVGHRSWLRSKTGSVYRGMLGHGATNALIAILVIASA